MLYLELLEAGPRIWHSPKTVILTIQGIFTPDQFLALQSLVE